MGLNHGEGALGPGRHTLNQIETIGDNFCDRTDNPTIDDPRSRATSTFPLQKK